MYCPNCGAKVEDDSLFCEECGQKLGKENVIPTNEEVPLNTESKPIVNSSSFVVEDAKENHNQDTSFQKNDSEQENIKRAIITSVVIGAIILLIVIISVVVSIVEKPKRELEAAQTNFESCSYEYDSLVSDLDLNIDKAKSLLAETTEDMVDDKNTLDQLSKAYESAVNFGKYELPDMDDNTEAINSQIESIRLQKSKLESINSDLYTAISSVESSIEEKNERIAREEKERIAAKLWPGTLYSQTLNSADGYTIQCNLRIGSWIKASDTETLNAAWEKAGGKGTMPDITSFNAYSGQQFFRSDKCAVTFATVEFINTTSGYDISESFPFSAMTYLNLNNLNSKANIGYAMQICYSNGTKKDTNISAKMTSNHWGPVTIMIAASNIFGPNFDTNGNPDLETAYFSFGNNSFRLPIVWKEPLSTSISGIKNTVVSHYDKAGWSFITGYVNAGKWIQGYNNDFESKQSLAIYRSRISLGQSTFFEGANDETSIILSKVYSTFEGDIIIPDDAKSAKGSTRVKFYNGSTLLYDSGSITGASNTIHFNVSVKDVGELKIVSETSNDLGPGIVIINDIIK